MAGLKKSGIAAEKAAVKSVMDQYARVWATEDVRLASQIFAHDDSMVNFGTDLDEHWVGWKALRSSLEHQFKAYEKVGVVVRDQVISVHKKRETAWVSEIIDFAVWVGGKRMSVKDCRFTGVLEKRKNEWIFVQSHLSAPVKGQAVEYEDPKQGHK